MESNNSKNQSLLDPLYHGIIEFNEGRYFEAHESWEDLWKRSTGAPRLYYQGLVQIAVGLHHITSGNLSGGTRVLQRGLEKLERQSERYSGIENHRLAIDIQKAIKSSEYQRIQILTSNPGSALTSDGTDETV